MFSARSRDELATDRTSPAVGLLRPGYVSAGLAFLTPIAAVLGGLAQITAELFLFRALIPLWIFLALFAAAQGRTRVSTRSRPLLQLTLFVWTACALSGLLFLWPDSAAARSVAIVVMGVSLVFGVDSVGSRISLLRPFLQGWLLAAVIVAIVGLRELNTGLRMPNFYLAPDQISGVNTTVASTLGNPNNLGMFVVMTFPVLFYTGKTSKPLLRLGILLLGATLIYLLFHTESRLAMLALALQVVALMFYLTRPVLRMLSIVVLGTLTVAGVSRVVGFRLLESEIISGIAQSAFGRDGVLDDSTVTRFNVAMNGVLMVTRTFGLGIGPGQFGAAIQSGSFPYQTGLIRDPHNAYVELAAQFSILTLLALLLWLGSVWAESAKPSFRCRFVPDSGANEVKLVCTVLRLEIVGIAVACMASSSFFTLSIVWAWFALVALMASEIESGKLKLRLTSNV